jgi:hypothetical protein
MSRVCMKKARLQSISHFKRMRIYSGYIVYESVGAVNYKFDVSTTRWCSVVLFQKSIISDGPSLGPLSYSSQTDILVSVVALVVTRRDGRSQRSSSDTGISPLVGEVRVVVVALVSVVTRGDPLVAGGRVVGLVPGRGGLSVEDGLVLRGPVGSGVFLRFRVGGGGRRVGSSRDDRGRSRSDVSLPDRSGGDGRDISLPDRLGLDVSLPDDRGRGDVDLVVLVLAPALTDPSEQDEGDGGEQTGGTGQVHPKGLEMGKRLGQFRDLNGIHCRWVGDLRDRIRDRC